MQRMGAEAGHQCGAGEASGHPAGWGRRMTPHPLTAITRRYLIEEIGALDVHPRASEWSPVRKMLVDAQSAVAVLRDHSDNVLTEALGGKPTPKPDALGDNGEGVLRTVSRPAPPNGGAL
jgi:hypothetical protein